MILRASTLQKGITSRRIRLQEKKAMRMLHGKRVARYEQRVRTNSCGDRRRNLTVRIIYLRMRSLPCACPSQMAQALEIFTTPPRPTRRRNDDEE